MKKNILILFGILLGVYIVLSLCDIKGNYAAERQLWWLNREFSFMAPRQDSTPDYAINKLADKYRDFIGKNRGTAFAQQGQLMLGNLYQVRKNYPQAKAEYLKAIGKNVEISAEAKANIARTYEIEGDWKNALAMYEQTARDYPITKAGFYIPMYLTSHLGSGEAKTNQAQAYGAALVFYKKIVHDYPKSIYEYNGLRMIALCQFYQNDWAGAAKTFGDLILKHPTGRALKEAVSSINIISVTKLHDYDLAISIYNQFMQQYPDHPVNPQLKLMIKNLTKLKDRNLIIKMAPKKQ